MSVPDFSVQSQGLISKRNQPLFKPGMRTGLMRCETLRRRFRQIGTDSPGNPAFRPPVCGFLPSPAGRRAVFLFTLINFFFSNPPACAMMDGKKRGVPARYTRR